MKILVMEDFIEELAMYCRGSYNGSTYDKTQTNNMLEIAVKYNKVKELIFLLQFNYEDCESKKEWIDMLTKNLR